MDGQPWSSGNHHALTATGDDNLDSHKYEYNRRLFPLHGLQAVQPAAAQPGRHARPPPGHAPGVLEHASITLPPLNVDFELRCGGCLAAGCADGCPDIYDPDDGGTGDGGVPDGGIRDGGPRDVDPIRDTSRDGCTQAGGGLTVLGLLTTLRLWRRRE